MSYSRWFLPVMVCVALVLGAPHSGFAQFGKLKDKAKKAVEKKVTDQVEKKEVPADTAAEDAAEQSEKEAGTTEAAAGSGGDEFQLYTKFDFVPGQTVLFYDDLVREEMGEFPSRWALNGGVFEVAEVGGDPWIMASTRGEIAPKLSVNQLPEKYTVEYEFLNRTAAYAYGHCESFDFLGADGRSVARVEIYNNNQAIFFMNDDKGADTRISDKHVPPGWDKGIHTIRTMVTKSSVKIYLDNERIVNAPRTAGFVPTGFQLRFSGDDSDFQKERMFFRNFRLAEGGKTMREQLDEGGRIVTHGIYFDVNSDKIKGESYKTLADIGKMLTDDGSLKLAIEGHTDSDGDDTHNMDLSKRRAESVKAYLVEHFKIDAARLEARGLGETKPIDANTTPEAKANNRRVELAKVQV